MCNKKYFAAANDIFILCRKKILLQEHHLFNLAEAAGC